MVRRTGRCKIKPDRGKRIIEIEISAAGLKQMFTNFLRKAINMVSGNAQKGAKALGDLKTVGILSLKDEIMLELEDMVGILEEQEAISDFEKRLVSICEKEEKQKELRNLGNKITRLRQKSEIGSRKEFIIGQAKQEEEIVQQKDRSPSRYRKLTESGIGAMSDHEEQNGQSPIEI